MGMGVTLVTGLGFSHLGTMGWALGPLGLFLPYPRAQHRGRHGLGEVTFPTHWDSFLYGHSAITQRDRTSQ